MVKIRLQKIIRKTSEIYIGPKKLRKTNYIYIYILDSTEFHAMVTTRYMIIREVGSPHENSCHANTFIILLIFHGKVGVY